MIQNGCTNLGVGEVFEERSVLKKRERQILLEIIGKIRLRYARYDCP